MENNPSNHPTQNKGIETYFRRHKNLIATKKGI
jgi:hypothetical protein